MKKVVWMLSLLFLLFRSHIAFKLNNFPNKIIELKTKSIRLSTSDDQYSDNNDIQSRMASLLGNSIDDNDVKGLDTTDKYDDKLDIRNRKLVNVVASAFLAFGLFSFEHFQPASSVMLLKEMESESIAFNQAFCNGKPTIIDFYADWCENCKSMAPTFKQLEFQYDKNVNFVTIDGANPGNSKLVERFRVDGIPHIAFITTNAEVNTALVGAVPKEILKSNIEALIKDKELPYEGYDAFEEESHFVIPDKNKFCQS